ncbi:MAG: tRNA (N6-isopentenyl adenosine(37)-C2)-methylthiotransferase MiaB [Polyangiaceae bacterium]|jgi:tRNA-2-methylthio-N6-dimethylallyladenosine synthase|nr:tRNA (N6-isopentenyl adenosine(37)-C2)-methylthiotransferase MiaB [Polyangiaceae bacterium]
MHRFYIHTFGCQMNVHDSQRMAELLRESGMVPADDPEDADLVVVNTCSVREKAEHKLDSELGKLRRMKARKAGRTVLAVAGCVAQQRGERLLARVAGLDIVLGPDNLTELPKLARAVAGGAAPVVSTSFDLDAPTFLGTRAESDRTTPSVFVSISKGCDERCSFCIVPSTRGPERHRSADEIIEEVRALAKAGACEVVLLGQTVNGYRDPAGVLGHRPVGARSDFSALLRRIAEAVPSLQRLRYTSSHPRYFDAHLADVHRELPMLCRHVHMPVQTGSDRMLRRMVRRHTRREYLDSVRALQHAQPGLTVSTDLIVGFPGETDDDFEHTLLLMREVPFMGVYAFKYSPRPGTPALRFEDDIPEHVKSERLSRVFELSDALQRDHLETLLGTVQRVLLEEPSPRGDGSLSGRTERNEIVHVSPQEGLRIGDGVVPLRIACVFRHSLQGELDRTAREVPDSVRRRLPLV